MNANSRPFILYGRSQLNACQVLIERALGTWQQSWFEDSVALPNVTVSSLEGPVSAFPEHKSAWHQIDVGGAFVYVLFDGVQLSEFFSLILGFQQDKKVSRHVDGVHVEVVQHVLNDFVSRWGKPVEPLNPSATFQWTNSQLPVSLFESGAGALLLTIATTTGKILFVVPSAVSQRMALVASAKTTSLAGKKPVSRITEVLGQEKVRLTVSIDAAEKVPFSAVSGLSVGDVILLNRKVREPFNLINTSGLHLGGCHIGRFGERRAIHIAAASAAGNLKGIPSNKP